MKKVNVCCQCSLKYADHLFQRGEYEKALPIIQKAVDIREDQSSISQGYAYFLLAMSREAVLREKALQLSAQTMKPVYQAYNTAFVYLQVESNRNRLLKQIKNRVMALEIETGIKNDSEYSINSIGKQEREFSRLLLKSL